MNRSVAELTEEALSLPQSDQLKLARALLENAEAKGDVEVAAEWEKEIEQRIQLVDSDLSKGRPFGDVLRDLDRRLKK
jgi:hypothetical protein